MAKVNPAAWVRSVVDEAKKVIWPGRDLVVRHTIMVIVSIAVGVVVFAGLDYGLQKLVLLAVNR